MFTIFPFFNTFIRFGHLLRTSGVSDFLRIYFLPQFFLNVLITSNMGRKSPVGIATRYGLDGPGIEFQWGRDFPHPSRPARGALPASYTMRTGSFPGVKRPGRGVDHPPHLSPRLRKEYSYTFAPPLGLRGIYLNHF